MTMVHKVQDVYAWGKDLYEQKTHSRDLASRLRQDLCCQALAKQLHNIVYLDKDTLIVLSKQIFKVAGQPYDRSSAFFEKNIRDYEYDCILALALEALDYNDLVLVNAPFTKEVRDNAFIADLKAKLAEKGATLAVIWVETSPDVVHQRMIERNSDRDTWKLAH